MAGKIKVDVRGEVVTMSTTTKHKFLIEVFIADRKVSQWLSKNFFDSIPRAQGKLDSTLRKFATRAKGLAAGQQLNVEGLGIEQFKSKEGAK